MKRIHGFSLSRGMQLALVIMMGATVAGILSACSAHTRSLADPVQVESDQVTLPVRSDTMPPTVTQVISENGLAVGLDLGGGTVLRFPTPQAKLYTDPLAFQSAVTQGIGGFLITPVRPVWGAACQPSGESAQISHCELSGTTIFLAQQVFAERVVWLASAEGGELARVLEGLALLE